ncbi:MAG: cytochrome c, partial [Planctomycetaceae bacterium]
GLHEADRQLGTEYDESFQSQLAEAERLAREIEAALKHDRPETATERLRQLEQSCKDCHQRYRD